jgi:hypothetical protein
MRSLTLLPYYEAIPDTGDAARNRSAGIMLSKLWDEYQLVSNHENQKSTMPVTMRWFGEFIKTNLLR